jgi:NADPH2:quinone reductase
MRAVEFVEYGGPEVLKVVEADAPEPGPGQVSVDVAYAGVNFADLKARSEGYRVPALPFRPGVEVSGRVRAVGAGVAGLAVGQEVAALTQDGAYADVVVADAATTFPLPSGVGLRTGATLPAVLPTAYALVHTVGRLQPGETVLVQGAAGGVGTAVGQLAKAAGAAAVYGVVSGAAKAAHARRYGYDDVFVGDFEEQVRAATHGRGVDLALDPVGGTTLRRAWRRWPASAASSRTATRAASRPGRWVSRSCIRAPCRWPASPSSPWLRRLPRSFAPWPSGLSPRRSTAR